MAFPAKAGQYDRNELFRLSSSVGFPGNFLVEGLECAPSPQMQSAYQRLCTSKPVRDRVVHELLKSKHIHPKLEKVFNKYPADYNRKVFLKAMSLLKHGRLNFSEISDTRLSFEVYMSEDGGGMLAEVDVVLQALKILERVMSPARLESEIQKQQAGVDLPSRIQMYEYMDLVVKSLRYSDVEKEMASIDADESDTEPLSDFCQLLITKEQQLLAHLDRQYRNSLFKKEADPTPPVPADPVSARSVCSSPRERARADSLRQRRALTPSLQYSQHQLLKARNGRLVFTPEQHREVELSLTLKQNSSRDSTRCNTGHGGSSCFQSSPSHQMFERSRLASRVSSRGRTPAPQTLTQSSKTTFLIKSKSAPLLPSLREYKGKTDSSEMVVEDLTEAICQICEKSVHSATNALRVSMSNMSQLGRLKEEGEEYVRVVPARRTGGGVARKSQRQIEPVVTELDIARHQGLIDDLEWREVRRRRKDPTFGRLRERSKTFS